MMSRLVLIISVNIISMSIILAAEWPNCEDYEQEIQNRHSPNPRKIDDIVLDKMVELKSDFEKKVINLHVEYRGKFQKDPTYQSDENKSKLEDLEDLLDIDKAADLEEISEITSNIFSKLTKLNKQKESIWSQYDKDELKKKFAAVVRYCDEATALLWDKIGEADQAIKSQLIDDEFPALNRIEQVKVTVPDDLESMVIMEIHAATVNITDDVINPSPADTLELKRQIFTSRRRGKSALWQTAGMKVAAESMRKEATRVDVELKTLQNTIAGRVRGITPNSNKEIDMFFKKFEHEILKCHKEMEESINEWFKGPEMVGLKCKYMDMKNIADVLKCLRIDTEIVAKSMTSDAERVVDLALVLNYLMEKEKSVI